MARAYRQQKREKEMFKRDIQIQELEEEIDKYLDLKIEPAFLNELLDELEELLVEREEHYKLRIVK